MNKVELDDMMRYIKEIALDILRKREEFENYRPFWNNEILTLINADTRSLISYRQRFTTSSG